MTEPLDYPFDHPFERGMRNRRAALGDAWVDKSVAKANAFNAGFQHFITDYAWHGVWGRPGLDWKTRRVLVMAVTCALGRWDEFEIHMRGSLTPGNAHTLTPEEVREALFQIAIYAGVPAANTGFSKALDIMRELGIEPPPHPADQSWHPGVGRSVFTRSRPKLHATVRDPRTASAQHTIVLSHALGQDASMWDVVANDLATTCKVITPDTRGHGRSALGTEPFSMADLADDAARWIDEAADGQPVIWVGLSMGGMIGQALAQRHPNKVKALVLANTTSAYDDTAQAALQQRADTVMASGMAAISDGTMTRFFSETFRAQQNAAVQRHQRLLEATDPEGYAACVHALKTANLTAVLPAIQVPTLLIASDEDVSTPPAALQAMHQAMPKAEYVNIPGCAHLSAVEQPWVFADLVKAFSESVA